MAAKFVAYVTLSRSRGRMTIRLLGDFNDNLLTSHPPEDLRREDNRLAELTMIMKQIWEQSMQDVEYM